MRLSELPDLLSGNQLADVIGVHHATVRQWRTEGTGPPYLKFAGTVRYRKDDVVAWFEASTVKTRTPVIYEEW